MPARFCNSSVTCSRIWPGHALFKPAQKTAALFITAAVFNQRWQPGRKPVVVTGNYIGGQVFELADVDNGFENRIVGPHVWTIQMANLKKLDILSIDRIS